MALVAPCQLDRRRRPGPGSRFHPGYVGTSGGQGLAEYALMLALNAIVANTLLFLGGQIITMLSRVGNSVQACPGSEGEQ